MPKRMALAVLGALAVFALAACGGDDGANDPAGKPAGGATAAPTARGTAVKDPTTGGYVAKMKALSTPPELVKGRKLGSDDAKVKLEMYEDFRCIHCLEFTADFEQFIIDSYVKTGKVQIQFRYFPLGQTSLPMMVAAECANQQDQFWPYAKKLFLVQAESYEGGPALPEGFSEAKLKEYAAALGLDATKYCWRRTRQTTPPGRPSSTPPQSSHGLVSIRYTGRVTAKEALAEWVEGLSEAEAAAELRRVRPGDCHPDTASVDNHPLIQLLRRTRAHPSMTEEEWNTFATNLDADRVSFGNPFE